MGLIAGRPATLPKPYSHREWLGFWGQVNPPPLGDLQPDHWLAEYTAELLSVLNVLGRLVQLEPDQVKLLEAICEGPLLTTLPEALEAPAEKVVKKRVSNQYAPAPLKKKKAAKGQRELLD